VTTLALLAFVRRQQTSCRRDDGRLRFPDGWYKLMKLPAAAERLVKGDELLGCVLLRYDILFFKIEFLALGVEDVQIIRQSAIIALGGKLGGLAGGSECAIKVPQAILFGRVGVDRIVDLLDSGQYHLFVVAQKFMCLQVGNIDFCVERSEIKQRPIDGGTGCTDQSNWDCRG
jgi:hypothetical protein